MKADYEYIDKLKAEIDELKAISKMQESKHERMYICYKEQRDCTRILMNEIDELKKAKDELETLTIEQNDLQKILEKQSLKDAETIQKLRGTLLYIRSHVGGINSHLSEILEKTET